MLSCRGCHRFCAAAVAVGTCSRSSWSARSQIARTADHGSPPPAPLAAPTTLAMRCNAVAAFTALNVGECCKTTATMGGSELPADISWRFSSMQCARPLGPWPAASAVGIRVSAVRVACGGSRSEPMNVTAVVSAPCQRGAAGGSVPQDAASNQQQEGLLHSYSCYDPLF
eukprot:COSAG02_NODE_19828_length_863_cov_0.638743_1_plen_169_part_10